MDTRYAYQSGKKYRVSSASSPEDYLCAALQAEKFIASAQVETKEGIYWEKSPAGPDDGKAKQIERMGLYDGSSGILYFYIKLYQVTGEERFLHIIKKAVSYLCIHLPEVFPEEIRTVTQYKERVSLDIGILGAGGIGFVLAEVFEEFHWDFAENVLHRIVRFYVEHRRDCPEGTCWTDSMTMITDSGVILFLLKYASLFPSDELSVLIRSAGESFLSKEIPLADGGARYPGLECVWPGVKPNFEVGTAGSGFLLSRLYEFTKERKYLESAERCAVFLHHCKIPQEKGSLIPFRLDQGSRSPFYLGTCSGPAGTCRFFYLLYCLTGNQSYLEEIYDLVEGMVSRGAPEHQSDGLWYNVNFCCGHAGLLQFFVSLYQIDGNEQMRQLAVRTANVILGEKEENADGSASWHVALERVNPGLISEPLGYYMGAAGIASSLLQIYLLEKGCFRWKRFIDDPFPENRKCR